MLDSKPIATPLATGQVFVSSGTPFSNLTLYRSLVGILQYLTITRPDLSFAVNLLSQFLHVPMEDHFAAVKCILRHVLDFTQFSDSSMVGYSDADWARYVET